MANLFLGGVQPTRVRGAQDPMDAAQPNPFRVRGLLPRQRQASHPGSQVYTRVTQNALGLNYNVTVLLNIAFDIG